MPTQETEKSFFKEKRSWSVIKDRVLSGYMKPYLAKLGTTQLPIILMDSFAGPGKFEDGTPGSPLIMCQMAARYGHGRCRCLFINKNKSHHRILTKTLDGFIKKKVAFTVAGESSILSSQLIATNKNFVLFGYFDPFGLKGCEFASIEKLLKRSNNRSTEVLINLNVSGLHRLAASRTVAEDRTTSEIKTHKILDDALGGKYWQRYMFDDQLKPEEKELAVVNEYKSKLKKLIPYVGSCPVREKENGKVKYQIIFCSGHLDGLALMNDFMCRIYNEHMHSVFTDNLPLLKSTDAIPDWSSDRNREKNELRIIIATAIKTNPGRARLGYWHLIIQNHFMKFLNREYNAVTRMMLDRGEIDSPTQRPTTKLNDGCILRLSGV